MGYSEKDIEGKGIIMTDAAIIYKTEGFYGDKITVKIAVNDLTKLGFDMFYKFVRDTDNKEIALVKTGIVFFDYQLKKVTGMPQTFSEKLI